MKRRGGDGGEEAERQDGCADREERVRRRGRSVDYFFFFGPRSPASTASLAQCWIASASSYTSSGARR
ncbi:hypothetical protein BH10PSE12_BH10PSE12_16800 [soil metagenome]